jgi:hypothetical protein
VEVSELDCLHSIAMQRDPRNNTLKVLFPESMPCYNDPPVGDVIFGGYMVGCKTQMSPLWLLMVMMK